MMMFISLKLKIGIVIALALVICGYLFWLATENWLRYAGDFGTMTVDGQRVRGDMYLGHPSNNQAEAFLLVKTESRGSYLFDFEGESYREVSEKEFIRLPGGLIIWTRMSRGPWLYPTSMSLNEFRVTSSGHIVDVRF